MPFNHHRVKAIHPTTYRGGKILAHDMLNGCYKIKHPILSINFQVIELNTTEYDKINQHYNYVTEITFIFIL